MTIPDKLIDAAAREMCSSTCETHKEEALVALTAAFAVLPECKEVVEAVRLSIGGSEDDANAALATLARMAE